jgi:hypothetical protein
MGRSGAFQVFGSMFVHGRLLNHGRFARRYDRQLAPIRKAGHFPLRFCIAIRLTSLSRLVLLRFYI